MSAPFRVMPYRTIEVDGLGSEIEQCAPALAEWWSIEEFDGSRWLTVEDVESPDVVLASQEMLCALKALVREGTPKALSGARAAIAKAEGGRS